MEFVYGYTYAQALASCLGLSWPLLSHGFFWQPVTYLFLHGSVLHVALNALVVLLFGSGLEREIGARNFWWVFLGGGVLAGFGWLAVAAVAPWTPSLEPLTHWMPQALRHWLGADVGARHTLESGLMIGASGGVFALIGAYAALFPSRSVYVLLLVIPVLRLSARTLVVVLVALEIVVALFVQSQVASSAHLAGCLAGYLFGLRLRRLGYSDDV